METSDTTLSTSQVAELLGWGDDGPTWRSAGYRRLQNAVVQLGIAEWTPVNVHRIQVAAALAGACPRPTPNQSPFPTIAGAVFANYRDPEPGSWAIYKGQAVSYVRYPADLARAIDKGAVVARIDRLWPEKEEGDDD
jgi:hypothetical protein